MTAAPIQLVLAADGGYAMPLAATLASVGRHHAPGECRATVLYSAMSEVTRRRIQADVPGVELRWVAVDVETLRRIHYPPVLSPATLYRLLLPALLPDTEHRVIYLDSDIVVCDHLGPLWDAELGDGLLGAVSDAGSPWAAGPTGAQWRMLGMAPDTAYFNAGVLLVDLEGWRREKVADRALDVLRLHEARWGDQDALNVVCAGRWTPLPRRWNVQTPDIEDAAPGWALWRSEIEQALERPGIVHYTGRAKPWTIGPVHPWTDRWNEVVDLTSWAGFRAGDRSLPAKVRRRVRRAADVLLHG